MKEQPITDALLREFLLGNVNDEERQRIEDLFLTDAQARERVLVAEQDLIEDYLENNLTTVDKETFLSLYAQTDEQRRKLRIAKSIKDWALTEAKSPQAITANVSVWSRLRAGLRLKPVFVVPIAVTIVIAIVLASVWLNSRREQRKHLAVERELAQLNSPTSLREVPPQMISLELKPVAVRSVEPPAELDLRPEVRIVEMRLPWIQRERYLMYQAELLRVRDNKSFTIPNLQPENNGQNVVRVRLPMHILSRGQYQIHLRGIADDGALSSAEEYSFIVSD